MFSFALVIPFLLKNTHIHHKKYYYWNRESESRIGIDIEHFIGIGIGIGIEVNFGIVPSLVPRIPRWSGSADKSKRKEDIVRICTVNIGTLLGKRREVVEMLARRQVDVCCLQEVRYKNQGTKSIGTNKEKYKIW